MEPPTPPPVAGADADPTVNQETGTQGGGTPNLTPTRADQASEALPVIETKEIEASQGLKPPPLPDGYEKLTSVKAIRVAPAVMQTALDVQGEFLNTVTPQMRQAFVLFYSDQRNRVMDKLADFKGFLRAANSTRKAGRSVSELDIDQVWHDQAENQALTDMFSRQLNLWGPRAMALVSEITTPGLVWMPEIEQVSNMRKRMLGNIQRVNETTKASLREQIVTGLRRRYTASQIANGVPSEKFDGFMGVFDHAMASRSETAARTEAGLLFSNAAIATYDAGGVRMVEVYDGVEFDSACADANGQLWTIDEADSNPQEHPNCTRFFVPVSK